MSVIVGILLAGFVFGAEVVSVSDTTVCCEKTKSGLYCQDVKEEDCSAGAKTLPTSCDSTRFCKGGYCFDSVEGTCSDNVPKIVCDENNGTWTEEMPPQCELGCCVLGDQASFVTLTRCKRLSAMLGLETNFNKNIRNSLECVLSTRAEEKGACVYFEDPADAQPTCKFTTRSECDKIKNVNSGETEEVKEEKTAENEVMNSPSGVEFHAGMLCSAEELGTNCGITKETTCIPGKEEVYFVDTCGNPANIYDASKINDKDYWARIYDKAESCNPESNNGGSKTCGNCNYILGSICRESNSETGRTTYGDYICADLGCKDEKGNERMHGESWCVHGGVGKDNVGSRYYRYSCVNNEVVSEPCADFRNEICIENTIETSEGPFTQAACRVNRWQDCTSQKTREDCMNNDKRDCIWLDGIEYVLMGMAMNGSTIDKNSLGGLKQKIDEAGGLSEIPRGACVPEHPPGLDFYSEGQDAAGVCGQANAVCPVTFEKGLLDSDWECVENCECLPGGELEAKRVQVCQALGDCGPKINWIGKIGSGEGYETKKVKKND